ncbi:MAG: glutaredoxin 2 [Bdellovibrionales bacterium]|nr:glutaredoxin 2 [Bdellovibrionales bacterium]
MKLYHYVHCPFCVRVRMGLGLLKIPYTSMVTPYDDEKTLLDLSGVKMLPIVVHNDGRAQNESLDILKEQDQKNVLSWDKLSAHDKELNPLLDKIGSVVHSLAMPYWIWTPEFNEASRQYFQKKKEVKRGPFKDLVKKQASFVQNLDALLLSELKSQLKPFYKSDTLSIMDLMIAAHLWGVYVVPEYRLPEDIHNYLQKVKAETSFDYHQDYWK